MLCHESTNELSFTKFPGGGLEYGEGLHDCLLREFQEELGITPEIDDIFHINEHFQQSAFHPDQQIISIYYTVRYDREPEKTCVEEIKWGKPYTVKAAWKNLESLREEDVTFPIDKAVVQKIIEKFT